MGWNFPLRTVVALAKTVNSVNKDHYQFKYARNGQSQKTSILRENDPACKPFHMCHVRTRTDNPSYTFHASRYFSTDILLVVTRWGPILSTT